MSKIELPTKLSTAHALIKELHQNNDQLRGRVTDLEHRLDVMSRRMFGRRSELLDPAQRLLAFEALEQEDASTSVVDDEPDMPEPEPAPKKRRRKRRHEHGRTPLPAHLRRDEQVLEPESTTCACCGNEMQRIGQESAEQLEYVPASYRVKKTTRPKYACGTCKEGVAVAPAPVDAIERCKAGPGLLAHVVVSKYADHLPLYRQCEMLEREGITLSDRTLGGWIRQVAELLRPVAQAQWRSILASCVLGADETTVRYLTPGRKGSKLGWLWAYRGDRREVCFDFTVGRGGDAPLRVLREYGGAYLQTDGYAAYDDVVGSKHGTSQVACWAHARRKFYDAQASDAEGALLMLALIGRLYDIEREVKAADLDDEEERRNALGAVRNEQSRAVLDDIKGQLDRLMIDALPRSPMGKAVGYALRRWDELTRYTNDPTIPIDNNAVEREMRAVAVGRKNWMFCGSRQAGKAAAVLYGLLNTCKLQGVNSEAWLRDVLIRIRKHPADRIAELTPRLWNSRSS